MGQKLNEHNQAEAACGHAMIDMDQKESVLILIKHCQDMKQQETCLRLVTLLLLLSCTTLFIFNICVDLRQRQGSGSSGQGSAAEQSPNQAFSKQDSVYPADNPQTNFQRLYIHLRSEPAYNTTDGQYIKWNAMFGEKYLKEKRAIVIPENGIYFVYVRIALSCHDDYETADFRRLFVVLYNWNEGYNRTVTLVDAWDGLTCTSDAFRSVFIGQLFDLSKGDHVSVWIAEGYNLVTKSTFGAYVT